MDDGGSVAGLVQTQMSGVQNCVVFSCREIKPYGRPYAKLTFFYLLLSFAYGDTCMHGYSYVVLTAKVCKSTMVTFDMLLQNKKGYRIKIDKFRFR